MVQLKLLNPIPGCPLSEAQSLDLFRGLKYIFMFTCMYICIDTDVDLYVVIHISYAYIYITYDDKI